MALSEDKNFKKFYKTSPDGQLHYQDAIKAREGLTKEEIAKTFDAWVDKGKYESDTSRLGYVGPQVTAETVSKLYDDVQRERIKILDVAAGTGLLSRELRKYGFKNIDGVDPSEKSKELAMKDGLYDRYVVDFVDEHDLDIQSESYDCVASTGGFAAGLMPCSAIKEFIRVAKIGGMICFSVPDYIYTACEEYRDRFEPRLVQYEDSGLWKRRSKTPVKSYLDNAPGTIYVFTKIKSL
ncbi:hypothetical protein LOTGIDRAFT_172244 [Lottia gigantea]|uniref:Methyltransferase type 11 domain-containing protein n=1 Tax=Lottia gigantea TaxID=225164 RepID=V4B467_LOTGI|nr:hypothetical protein LOTGIDRAFT_172244 [Lottia gigantea]ESP02246.1 hypothetical protein LOTGIDRAFT_172244 [Lottia gigantea]